jgi:DNA/RNA endonuclease YhcR with UshA esterase domain
LGQSRKRKNNNHIKIFRTIAQSLRRSLGSSAGWQIMRMQKEEKIVVVLLLMALGSLAVAFWAFAPEDGVLESSSDSNAQNRSSLFVEGLVKEINPTKNGGNLIIRLDTTPLPVFISKAAGADELVKKVHLGDRIQIRGKMSEFNGNEEIEVERSWDIELLNS